MRYSKYIGSIVVLLTATVLFSSSCAILLKPQINQREAVVIVNTPDSIGTGFVINSSGCVLTARHVVDELDTTIRVDRPGVIPYLPYHVERLSETSDIALLCPDAPFKKIPVFLVFSHEKIDIGGSVFLYGWYEKERQFVDRTGLSLDEISFEMRGIEYSDISRIFWFQPLMSGFSGSPVLSVKTGNVVGLLVVCTAGPIPPDAYFCGALNAETIFEFLHQNNIEHWDGDE